MKIEFKKKTWQRKKKITLIFFLFIFSFNLFVWGNWKKIFFLRFFSNSFKYLIFQWKWLNNCHIESKYLLSLSWSSESLVLCGPRAPSYKPFFHICNLCSDFQFKSTAKTIVANAIQNSHHEFLPLQTSDLTILTASVSSMIYPLFYC